jgi:hypothetical protein
MQASLVDFKDIKILPWFACIKLWSFYSPFLLDWGFFCYQMQDGNGFLVNVHINQLLRP